MTHEEIRTQPTGREVSRPRVPGLR
jgi:hypothetical protein